MGLFARRGASVVEDIERYDSCLKGSNVAASSR